METTLYPSLVNPFGGRPGHRVVNLRLAEGRGRHARMEAVPACAVLSSGAGLTPLCSIGSYLVGADAENYLIALDVNADSASPTGVHLPGEALCAVASAPGETTVMTTDGPARVVADAGGSVRVYDESASYPPVSLRAVQVGAVSAQVPRRKLSATFASEQKLSAADASGLLDDYRNAYLRLAADAAANAAFLQPVLARYRLLDSYGMVLFTSPAVILSLPCVTQCAGPAEVMCDPVDGYASAYDMVLNTWRIEVGIPAQPATRVAAVQVLVSPQFHPLGGGSGVCNLVREGGGYTARVVLPGVSAGIGVSRSGTEATVMAAVARMDSIAVPALRINNPFTGAARSVEVAFTPEVDADATAKSLRAALEGSCPYTEYEKVLLSAPHRFTAMCGATDGISTVWGSPSVFRFGGWHPAIFASNYADESWSAVVTVRFANGHRVTRLYGGTTGAPTTLGPVMSYPSPDAVSMSISISSGAKVRRFDCLLTPDASGCQSVFVAPDGKPIVPEETEIIDFDEECDDTVDLPGIIAVAPAHSPLAVRACLHSGCGMVRAMAASPGSEQSWEVGRSRFLAACAGGIVSVSAPSDGKGRMSVRIVDPRGVERTDALAAGIDRVYVLVSDSAGYVPLAINGRGRCEAIAATADYQALCVDRNRNEVWLLHSGGDCDVIGARGMYVRRGQVPTAFRMAGGSCYGIMAAGLLRVGVENTSAAVPVAYSNTISADDGAGLWMLRGMRANMESTGLLARLDVSATRFDGSERLLLLGRFINGEVRSPITMRIPGCPARSIAVHLEGMAASGTIVESFRFFAAWMRK